MQKIVEPFVFEEHIFKADYSIDIEKTKRKLEKIFLFKSKKEDLRKKLKNLESLQEKTCENYSILSLFFEKMTNQKYCKIDYVKREHTSFETHEVKFSGEGIKRMFVHANPKFFTDAKDGGISKIMKIPAVIGSSEEEIILYEHPQIPLPVYSNLIVKYKSDSSMDLGSYLDGKPILFTEDICEEKSCNFPFQRGFIKYLYGKPGKVFFRGFNDALGEELHKAIFSRKTINRERFNLQVQIFLEKDNQFFYQGNMDNTGLFPFLVKKDDEGECNLNPLPIESLKVEKK